MKERCCQFGPEGRLAGIITEPTERAPTFGLVLVSAGLVPKFGPYRLYAELARHLASEGVVSLRFDLGGIGESAPEPSARPLKARTELEIQAALGVLKERYDLQGIALGGLCSGAEDSLRSAAMDPRVTRVVLIDPFAYRTWGWAWRNFVHRSARRILRGLGLYRPLTRPRTQGSAARVVRYQYMAHAEAKQALDALLKRRVRVHFLYTGGARELFNHQRQLQASFSDLDFKGLVSCDYLPNLDHTQLLEADRQHLIEVIAHRLGEQPTPRRP